MLIDGFKNFGRHAAHNGIGRYVFGHHRSGGDNGVFADSHAGHDGCAHADPDIFLNDNRGAKRGTTVCGINGMADSDEIDFRAEKNPVANG